MRTYGKIYDGVRIRVDEMDNPDPYRDYPDWRQKLLDLDLDAEAEEGRPSLLRAFPIDLDRAPIGDTHLRPRDTLDSGHDED